MRTRSAASVALLLALSAARLSPAAAAAAPPRRDPEADRVTGIPGLAADVCWKHYSGYLHAGGAHRLFYWYHEATESPEDKPLVLWLNGGPGCSSLGGMFTELGPFVLDAHLNVTLNPYAFNKAANIIFIEQPAGVGFSYPNVPANDSATAADTDRALRDFLSMHPELQGRDFWVMGESCTYHRCFCVCAFAFFWVFVVPSTS